MKVQSCRILIISNKLIRFHLKNSLNKKKSLNKLFDQNFPIKNILKYLQKLIITKQYITYYYIILTGFEYSRKLSIFRTLSFPLFHQTRLRNTVPHLFVSGARRKSHLKLSGSRTGTCPVFLTQPLIH